jgi:hypothetical protein
VPQPALLDELSERDGFRDRVVAGVEAAERTAHCLLGCFARRVTRTPTLPALTGVRIIADVDDEAPRLPAATHVSPHR